MRGIYAYYDTVKDEIVYVGKDSYIHQNKTVKNDFTILFRFCELQDEEDLK